MSDHAASIVIASVTTVFGLAAAFTLTLWMRNVNRCLTDLERRIRVLERR